MQIDQRFQQLHRSVCVCVCVCVCVLETESLVTVRNEVAKVMFSQACVCPQWGGVSVPRGVCFRGEGGVCSRGVWSGGVWSRGVSGPGGCLVWGVGIPACTEADPPGETATAADGTHPTGMHSCLLMELEAVRNAA